MIVADFLNHADERIMARGKAYFDSGRVGPFEELAPGLWHTVVRGTEDYQVDIRLRHESIISAACSCPYAQRSAFCKHIVAAVLALKTKDETDSTTTPRFPRDASSAVKFYAIQEFPLNRLDDEDWKAVRRVLERLYGFPDLKRVLIKTDLQMISRRADLDEDGNAPDDGHRGLADPQRGRDRAIARLEEASKPQTLTVTQLHEEAARHPNNILGDDAAGHAIANMRILVPFLTPTHLDQLPHTWLTILEAAYEHLHDRDGLRMLYRLYIITARTEPESVYVRRLRELSGPDWPLDRDAIIRFCTKYPPMMLIGMRNPAYERLLREERLGKEALDYCRLRTEESLIRMLDVIATDPESSVKALERLRDVLTDPDSVIYAKSTVDYAQRIARLIRRIDDVYGYDEATTLSEQIVDIFPRRTALSDLLRDYLHRKDTESDEAEQDDENNETNDEDGDENDER